MRNGCTTLGRESILRMQSEGTQFLSGNSVRVANGWMMLTVDARGNYGCEVISDPADEPEKWIDDAPKPQQAELEFA